MDTHDAAVLAALALAAQTGRTLALVVAASVRARRAESDPESVDEPAAGDQRPDPGGSST